MEIEIVQKEFERLSWDKSKIDEALLKLESELSRLRQNKDMIVGAMQTCTYLISTETNSTKSEEVEKTNKKWILMIWMMIIFYYTRWNIMKILNV